MSSRLTTIGNGFVLSGVFLAGVIALAFLLLSTPVLPLSSCTDVGYVDGPPGGFEYYAYSWIWMEYSPDGGVNRCSTSIVTITVGLFAIGSGILGIERWNR